MFVCTRISSWVLPADRHHACRSNQLSYTIAKVSMHDNYSPAHRLLIKLSRNIPTSAFSAKYGECTGICDTKIVISLDCLSVDTMVYLELLVFTTETADAHSEKNIGHVICV